MTITDQWYIIEGRFLDDDPGHKFWISEPIRSLDDARAVLEQISKEGRHEELQIVCMVKGRYVIE